MIPALDAEGSGIHFFRTERGKLASCTALTSCQEQESFYEEGIRRMELDNLMPRNTKQVCSKTKLNRFSIEKWNAHICKNLIKLKSNFI